MINKPFHNLSEQERQDFIKNKRYVTPFPNRSQRRSWDSNKNLVRQDVTLKDERENVIGTKPVYHRKPTNIPYQYLGVHPVKGSQAEIRNKEKQSTKNKAA